MAKSKGPNKREILFRLLEVPDKGRRPFFAREMKMLNTLCERYSLEFMDIVSFTKKFDSLAYILSDKLKKKMDETKPLKKTRPAKEESTRADY